MMTDFCAEVVKLKQQSLWAWLLGGVNARPGDFVRLVRVDDRKKINAHHSIRFWAAASAGSMCYWADVDYDAEASVFLVLALVHREASVSWINLAPKIGNPFWLMVNG